MRKRRSKLIAGLLAVTVMVLWAGYAWVQGMIEGKAGPALMFVCGAVVGFCLSDLLALVGVRHV